MAEMASCTEFEHLIEARLREAECLLNQKEWLGAYYLAGYAIEYALKVHIIKELQRSDRYPDRRSHGLFMQHNLTALLTLSGLSEKLNVDIKGDNELEVAWGVVKDWSEQSRYVVTLTGTAASDLFGAVKVVLRWIQHDDTQN